VVDTVLNDRSKLDAFGFADTVSEGTAKSLARAAARTEERFAPVSGVIGLFNACSYMRGDEEFLLDLAEDPSFAKALVERLVPHVRETGWQAVESTGTADTALWYYDEYSSRLGPLLSPKSFESIFLPAMKSVFDEWKARGLKDIVLHCDGNSMPLLDLLMESGLTAIQSMAPTAGMWLPDVQKRCGDRLTLIGGMCNMTTLAHGTKEEIRAQAEAVAEAGREGGVILGTHSIGDDVPVANYDYFDSVMREIDARW
jgi:uroporphyrinogen decarboxylase